MRFRDNGTFDHLDMVSVAMSSETDIVALD